MNQIVLIEDNIDGSDIIETQMKIVCVINWWFIYAIFPVGIIATQTTNTNLASITYEITELYGIEWNSN